MIEYKKRRGTFWKVENGVKTVISAEEYDELIKLVDSNKQSFDWLLGSLDELN